MPSFVLGYVMYEDFGNKIFLYISGGGSIPYKVVSDHVHFGRTRAMVQKQMKERMEAT